MTRLSNALTWAERNSLALAGLALSLFSSGIDGEYMSAWMPTDIWWTGYLLNTTADVAVLVLARWLGRLQSEDSRKAGVQARLRFALSGEYAAIAFSWFFGYRQLRPIIALLELSPVAAGFGAPDWVVTLEIELVSFVAAGFVPVLNAYLGYAQALRDGVFDTVSETKTAPVTVTVKSSDAPVKPQPAPVASPKPIDAPLWRQLASQMNGDRPSDGDGVLRWLQSHGYETKSASTRRRWAEIAQEVVG